MDKRNINMDRQTGITGLSVAEQAVQAAKVASNNAIDANGDHTHVTVNVITTQIDPLESDFIVCAYCGGKNLKSAMIVSGGANANLKVPDKTGALIDQDVAQPIKLGSPTVLGNDNRCGYCGEDPVNPKRSDTPKYNYGNGKTEQSI